MPFSDISAQDLRSNDSLADLYREAVRRGWWGHDGAAVVDFWSLAEKALEDDKLGTPGRLFHSLVKDKATTRITNAQETRALERLQRNDLRNSLVADSSLRVPASPAGNDDAEAKRLEEAEVRAARRAEIYRSDELDELLGADIGFSPAIFMQCFFPQKPLPDEQRTWSVSHGNATLQVEAGSVADEKANAYRPCAVPSGSKARLLLPYIVRQAVAYESRVVDLGRSLRNFMGERMRMPITGRNGKVLVREIENLAMASIILGYWNNVGRGTAAARVATKVMVWAERDPRQGLLWTPEMELSRDFFDAIREHRVPVNMDHLRQLSRSPRRMDLYSWLSYRLPQIGASKGVVIPLRHLQQIFAPDITNPRHFTHKLKADLRAIHLVYPHFQVEIDGDKIILRRSPPPVPKRTSVQLAD